MDQGPAAGEIGASKRFLLLPFHELPLAPGFEKGSASRYRGKDAKPNSERVGIDQVVTGRLPPPVEVR